MFWLYSFPSAQVPLVAAADLKRELETLQYREHKKLAIQGQIAAVQYMETPEPQGLKDKEVNDLILNRLPKSSCH